jgi:hypothetical protein
LDLWHGRGHPGSIQIRSAKESAPDHQALD